MNALTLSPELSALINICARASDNEWGIGVGEGRGVDEERLACLAARHGVSAILDRGRGRSGDPKSLVPSTMNLRMAGELIQLTRKMERLGIRVIPYKGPTLASLAYGDLSLRMFGDLDLLIAREDTGRAFSLLREQGYAPEIDLDEERLREFEKQINVLAWWSEDRQISVELHWELSPAYLPFPVGFNELYQRRQDVEVGGHAVTTLSTVDLLVYLCLHGAKHAWERLSWIADVGWLIRRQEVDWETVLETGRGYERILGLGLELARRVTGVELPRQVREMISDDPTIAAMSDRVLMWLENPPGWITRTRFLMEVCGSRRAGVRLLRRILMTPSAADWKTIRLPAGLSAIYNLIRLFRLFGKALAIPETARR